MNLSEEEQRQFVRAMVEILDNHAADLTAAGFDPANKKAELTALAEDADDKEGPGRSAPARHSPPPPPPARKPPPTATRPPATLWI